MPVYAADMASITIRNLDDDVKAQLRLRAECHGRSMEEEARQILREAVEPLDAVEPQDAPEKLADAIIAIFEPLGGVELDIPPRGPDPGAPEREPPTFD